MTRNILGKRVRRSNMFELFTFSDDEDGQPIKPPPAEVLRHTQYSAGDTRVATRTTYITTETTGIANNALKDSEAEILEQQIPGDFKFAANAEEYGFDDVETEYLHDLLGLGSSARHRRKRSPGDNPLLVWKPDIDVWLAEMVRLEGRGFCIQETCPQCMTGFARVRCRDCHDTALYCESCIVAMHHRHPFHRISSWTGTHFQRDSFKRLRLRIQLGHPVHQACTNPVPASGDSFVVLDVSGIHEVGLDFCGCETAQARAIQLLRARLFPGTSHDPKTAATFGLLEYFHLLSTQSKISGWEFYTALARRTDNTGVDATKDRYPVFMRMMRKWRFLKLLKRAGRGHDAAGVIGTQPGSCAVLCPACPQPDKNLPPDWLDAPENKRWIYRLFIGLDANFRLKRKIVSNDERDPGLNQGYAYFVEESAYKQYLKTFEDAVQSENSTCNNHDAVKLANMKGAQGMAASGVGTVECSRHDMKRPCSVGDLQKGERYINMDYLFFSSLSTHATIEVVVSYDISCQWSKNIWDRFSQYKWSFDAKSRVFIFVIPKFHILAHKEACQINYSLNLTPRVGRTDGEAVERGWAAANAFATSTKEMGPGARRDLLDDVFGDYNWRKICHLAGALLKKVKNAVDQRSEQNAALRDLTVALPLDLTTQWTREVEVWEADPSAPNPFAITCPSVTQAAVRVQLAQEESARIIAGNAHVLHAEVSPSVMITTGLDLEDQQRRLRADASALSQHPTDLQRAKILERKNALHNKIEAWSEIQQLYMPAVAAMRALRASDPAARDPISSVTEISLLLPSQVCTRIPCDNILLESEWRLRHAQAHDILDDLRRHLRLLSHLYNFKDRFVRGQRPNTRARTIISTVDDKIKMDTARYRATYAALQDLSPILQKGADWHANIRPLEDADVRVISECRDGESEGRRTLSWIWRAPGVAGSDGEQNSAVVHESLRIEWCKARARARRWTEECDLLEEEMRRVIAFHDWQARWWLERIPQWEGTSSQHREGLIAYAHRQAAVRRSMQEHCKHTWRYVPEWLQLGCSADADDAETDEPEEVL